MWGISGLWHGANWTFVCWGLFHATLLAIYNILGINTKYRQVVAYGRFLPSIKEVCQMMLTFFLAVIGWIIFRAETMTQTVSYLRAMVCNKFFDASALYGWAYLCMGLVLLFVEWLQRDKQHALQFPNSKLFGMRMVRWCVYYLILLVIVKFAGASQTFIYFQF